MLREYKIQVDEILGQQAEMAYDLQGYTQKVHALEAEDARIFETYLNRQRETAVGLIFSKTGRKITEKLMDNVIRRQVSFPFSQRLFDVPTLTMIVQLFVPDRAP